MKDLELQMTVSIIDASLPHDGYSVWFQLADERGTDPCKSDCSFCAGVFDTFDEAYAAVRAIRGISKPINLLPQTIPRRGTMGARIKSLREGCGWSKSELGRRLGGKNPRAAVYLYETDKRIPNPDTIWRLAKIFACDFTQIDPIGAKAACCAGCGGPGKNGMCDTCRAWAGEGQ